MPSLSDLQRGFSAALVDRGPAASPRMAVYRANVHGSWSKALVGAYPIVRKMVGEEFFEGMAREYAHAFPSTSGDLSEYGERLAEFLAVFAHTQDVPYLPDVARMEWLAHRAYYAADAAPFDPRSLSCVPPERHHDMRISLAPACAMLASQWPLAKLWAVHQDGLHDIGATDLAAGPDRILVHRPFWRAEVYSLAPGDYRFLKSALSGATLGSALEAAVAHEPAFDPASALSRWVRAGVIVRLELR